VSGLSNTSCHTHRRGSPSSPPGLGEVLNESSGSYHKAGKDQLATQRKKILIVGTSVTLITVALVTWYLVAANALAVRVSGVEAMLASVRKIGAGAVQNGKPASSISFDALVAYAAAFEQARTQVEERIRAIQNGEGTAFWLSASRNREATRLAGAVKVEAELASAARQAITSTDQFNRDVGALSAQVVSDWTEATNALSPQSDVEDFERQIAIMVQLTSSIQATDATLRREQQKVLTGVAGQFREGLLAGFADRLRKEQGRVDARRESLALARRELQDFKTAVYDFANGSQSLLSTLNHMTTVLLPGVNYVFGQTGNLRKFVRDAERPLGGDAGKILNGLLGRASSEPVTAASLASKIWPGAGTVISGLVILCDSIEAAHAQVNELANSTELVLPTLRAFVASGSRADLAALSASAPRAASYFEAHRGPFDPMIERIETLKPSLNRLSELAASIPVPPARSLLEQGVALAFQLIVGIESPFREANSIIDSTGASMRQIGERETRYLARLNELKSWSPTTGDEAGRRLTEQSSPSSGEVDYPRQFTDRNNSPTKYQGAVQPSFDCARAHTPVEMLICRDRRLAALEVEMASSYHQTLNRLGPEARLILRRDHLTWFKNYSRTCNQSIGDSDRATCVADFLSTHTSQLRTWQ
jgi:hypothetical protein